MKKLKKIFKRTAALMAAATLGITGLAGSVPASAEKSGVNISYTWNSSVNPYIKKAKDGAAGGVSGQYLKAGEQICRFQPSSSDDWAFCIEPAKSMQGTSYGDWMQQSGFTEYDTFDSSDAIEAETTRYWSKIKSNYELYMGLVQYYGYSSHKNGNYYAATQLILWEMILGYRGHNEMTFKNCSDKLWNDFTYPNGGWCTQSGVEKAYDEIVYNVIHHYDRPSALKESASFSKADPAIMKYNTANMRYEATVTVPTSSVTSSSIAHNFSSLKGVLEKLTKDNFKGTYGTDYGVTSSVSGSNTVYTIWSKERQFTDGIKTSDAIQLQTKNGISEQENLFAHSYYQTCLISTQIDSVSGYVSLAAYNEPNLTVEKTYYDANGNQVTSAASLNSLLSSTSFTVSTSINGKKYYVVASLSGSAYVFSRYTENLSEATKFKSQTTISGKGIFNVNDLPTAAAGGRTYTVSEIAVPTNYDKISQTVSLPSPNADDYSTNPGTKTAKFANKTYSADYGDATIYKNVENSAENLSTKDLSSVYADTKFVAAYWDGNTVRYFTKAYKVPYQALPTPMDMTKLGLSVSDLPGYTTGDGQYYLPITVDDNHKVSFNTAFTSTNIADAYVFIPGYNYDAEAGSTCDYFGKVFLNFDTINVNNKKATSIYFVEIAHAKGYGYDLDSLSNTLPIPLNSIFAISNTAVSSGLLIATSNISVSGNSIVANNVYPYAISAVSGESRQAYGEINNERLHYNMNVTKTDTADEPISGAVFGLYKGSYSTEEEILSVKPLETAESDENGNVTFLSNLITENEYSIYEISAPTGYVRDNTIYPVTLADTSSTNIFVNAKLPDETKNVENSYHDLIIEINKKDAINDIAISGIQFDISLNGTVVDTVTTDENGYAASAELELGKLDAATNNFENVYTVTEKADSDYHLIDENGNFIDSFEIVVSGNDIVNDTTRTITYSAAVNNYLETVDLSVYKVDNFDKPLKGVTFDIRPTADIKIKGNIIQKKGETVGTITTDENGYASSTYVEYEEGSTQGYTRTVTIYAGHEYELIETSTPDPYIPSGSTKFTVEKSADKLVIPHEVTIINEEKTGSIKVHKRTDGMTDILGIKFILGGVSDTGRDISETAVTDNNGVATFSKIPVGTYTVTEDGSTVPYGYFTADEQSVTVSYNKTSDMNFDNEYQHGTITVYKRDNENNTFFLAGAEFNVVSTDTVRVDGTEYKSGDVIETIVTDVTGKAVTTKLYPVGHTYRIVETKSPDGYVKDDEFKNATLSFDSSVKYVNTDVNFTNSRQQGSITVYKVDADDNTKLLSGAVFEVIADQDIVVAGKTVYTKGDVIDTITTGTDGKAVTSATLYSGFSYSLREIKAPDGYVLADTEKTIFMFVDANVKYVSVSETIENKNTQLAISKQDVYGNELVGAEMQLFDSENTIVEAWTSDGTNHIVKGLKAGEYTLHEKAAPDGYIIATDIKFTIDNKNVVKINGVEATATTEEGIPAITMVDDTTKVEIKKLDEDGNPVDGAELELYDEYGELVDSWTSDTYYIENKLKAGMEYKLHEKTAPDGYVLTGDIKFTVSLDGRIDKIEMIDKSTKVKFSKKSMTGEDEVVGATIRVYDSNGNVIDEWVSTSEPHYVIAKYIAGATYTMKEIVVPNGYVKSDDIDFTVSEDGGVDVVTMYDDITKVEISKTDITNGKLIEGAVLEIKDKNDKLIDKWTTKLDEPHKLNGVLIAGETYTLTETFAPDGYVLANTVEFTVSSDGSIDKVEMQDERAVGAVKVTKHTEGQKFVKDIEFILSGTSVLGEEIRVASKTDENGIAEFNDVPIGTYTLSENGETVAQEIYVQSEEQTVDVATDETTIVDFINLEKQGEITVTKTTEENKNIENIKFILKGVSDSGREIELTAVTDENGKAVFTKVPVGTYEIYEDDSTVPYAYLSADKQTAVVTYSGNTTLEFHNEEKTGEINVYKHTEGDKNIENIKFILKGVSDTGREIELTAVTDENGKAVFTNVPIGTYEIYEDGSTVPYAYMTAEKQSVTVVYAESNDVDFENEEKKGSITVVKHTEGDLNIEGIKFILTGTSDTGREIYSESITDENGIAAFESIPIGSYVIKEDESSVNYAYLVANEQTITVEYENNSEVQFFNSEKTGSIKVSKRTEGDLNVSGINFTLSGTSDSGRYIEVSAVTDTNGIATFDNLPIGTYTVVEDGSTVPYAYLIAEPQDVQVMYAETTNVDFLNVEKSGSIKVHKTTEGQLNVEGISFILSGTSDSGRYIEVSAITDTNGIAAFNNIPIGTYTITEDGKTVPYGYLVADPQEVTVMYAETVDATVLNKEQTGEITVHKTTEGQRNISGITFILSGTSDTGREIKLTAVTDKDGIAKFENIPIGTYTVTEDGKTVPYGYLVADPQEVTVMYAETVDSTVLNKEQTGSVKIQKRTEGMTDISGIKFILKGTSDTGREINISAVTDKDGIALFENIPIGTYEIYEDGSSVPYGYLVADAQSVTVSNAETSAVTFNNEKIPEEKQPEIPTTPNVNTGARVGSTLSIITLSVAIMIMVSRKRKKED